MKKCSVCLVERPLNCFYFRKDNNAYRASCKECFLKQQQKTHLKRKDLPEYKSKIRKYSLKHNYGITLEDYNALLEKQERSCAICKSKEVNRKTDKNFCVDHNHKTGEVRGLLCHSCNAMLGKAKENSDTLRNAAAYLEERGDYKDDV
jgi:hypothetical protein